MAKFSKNVPSPTQDQGQAQGKGQPQRQIRGPQRDAASLGITFDYKGNALKINKNIPLKHTDFQPARSQVREDLTEVVQRDFNIFRSTAKKKDATSLLISQMSGMGSFKGGGTGSYKKHAEGEAEMDVDIDLETDRGYNRIFLQDKDGRQIKRFPSAQVSVSPTFGVRLQKAVKKQIKGEADYLDAMNEVKNFNSTPSGELQQKQDNEQENNVKDVTVNGILLPKIDIDKVQEVSEASSSKHNE